VTRIDASHGSLLRALGVDGITHSDGACRVELRLESGIVTFTGTISEALREYGGDCASAWSAEGQYDLSGAAGLALRARGDGRSYRLRLRTAESFADVCYEADLGPLADGWQELEVAWARFEPVHLWLPFAGHPPLDARRITSIGLAVPRRREGPFVLELASIEPYRREAPRVEPSPTAERWEAWIDAVLWPLSLGAAERHASTDSAAVFAGSPWRTSAPIHCYLIAAESACEPTIAFRAASTAKRHPIDPRTRLRVEAVLHLALTAAYERAIATDLVAVTPPGCAAPPDFLAREAEADRAFERWLELDRELTASLARAGLALDELG
jgi:hypothetical protein